jgi:glutaredoxin
VQDQVDSTNTTASLLFYTTAGCHLCEMAENILYAAGVVFTSVDIEEDLMLIKQYGTRIPVLKDPRGRELGWPFDGEQLSKWMLDA